MPKFPRVQSAPALSTSPLVISADYELCRRRTTLELDDNYHPRMVLQLVLSEPSHAYIGIGPNLRSLIGSTIKDLQNGFSPNTNANDEEDQKLIDDALLRLQIPDIESFIPLQPSIENFEFILQQKYTLSLIKAVCHALVGSFLSGFNTSLLNVPALLIQQQCNINLTTFSLLQSMYCVGGGIGALCVGFIADRYGRRITLIFSNSMFMASGIISFLYAESIFGPISNPNLTFLYFIISRILSGISSGISTAIVPTYLGEISPPIIRGEIGTLNAFINAFGILFAELIACEYILGSEHLWKYMFCVNIIPFIIQLLFIKSLCESPQWLLFNNIKEKAEDVFKWLRESDHVEVDMQSITTKKYYDETTRIRTMWKSSRSPSKMTKRGSCVHLLQGVHQYDAYGSIEKMKSNQSNHKIVLFYIFFITVCLQILQQLSGINSVWYYSSMMLQNAGLTSTFQLWIGNVLIASSNFFAVLIPVQLIERIGRKLLLYISCTGMIIASIALSAVLKFADDIGASAGYLSIGILVIYVISFSIGLGPVVGLSTVELAPSSHRGTIVSIAFFINYSANLFVAQFSNKIVEIIYYLPFAGICVIGIIFVRVCLIETKGKKEMDIQMEIAYKVTGNDDVLHC